MSKSPKSPKSQGERAQEVANASMPDIPAGLKRAAKPVSDAAKAIAAKHNTQAAVDALKAAAATPATPVEPAKPVTPAKRKPAKAAATTTAQPAATPAEAHKPSTIESTAANPSKSIVPSKFKALYKPHNDTNGSPLNLYLKEKTTTRNAEGRESLDIPALKAIAQQNGIDFAAYEHLNNGQKRMNVGNKLAGMLKAGKKVTVGTRVFADATKALAKPQAAPVTGAQAA